MFNLETTRIDTRIPPVLGSFGKIYAYGNGKNEENPKWVVKHVHAADAKELRFFMQEAVLSFNYKNPCVVSNRGYDFKEAPNGGFDLFIKMPRMDTSLKRVIGNHARNKTRPALNDDVLKCFYNAASGLNYLQRKRIIHNNINPGTILIKKVEGEDFAKVGAIGLAQHKPWKEGEKSLGTFVYTAPERLKRGFKPDKDTAFKGDVWSLGLTIMEYCLLKLKKYEPEDDCDWLLGEDEAQPKEEKKMSDEERAKIGTVIIEENLENIRKEYGKKLGDIEEEPEGLQKLIDILQETFKINPKERISFQGICERLDQQFPGLKMKDKISAIENDVSQYYEECDEIEDYIFYNEDYTPADEESSKNFQKSWSSLQFHFTDHKTGNESNPKLAENLDLNYPF